MNKHQDILYGLAACFCSLVVFVDTDLSGIVGVASVVGLFVGPFFWVTLAIATARSRQKTKRKLWWVWISGPLALYGWIGIIFAFFAPYSS